MAIAEINDSTIADNTLADWRTAPDWQSQSLEQWLVYKTDELQALGMDPDVGLPAFERALVAALRADYPKARTFAEKASAIQSAKKRNASAYEITANDIIWNIRQLRNEHQGVQQRAETQDLVRKSAELDQRADQLARDEQLAWEADRSPRDKYGQPTKYLPAHAKQVAGIETDRRQRAAAGDHFTQKTDRLEVAFFRFLETTDILGPGVHIEANPTSKYDDYGNHMDAVLHIHLPQPDGQNKRVTLGVDFTISESEHELTKKLHHITSKPFNRLDYGTEQLQSGTKCINALLALDETRMDRIRDGYYLEQAANEKGYQHLSTLGQRQAQSRALRDDKVCKWMVVDALLVQLKEQLAELTTNRSVAPDIRDHQLLIDHLTKLRGENKDLRRDAVAEVNKEMTARDVGATYRIADPQFVHRARINYRPQTGGEQFPTTP